METSMVDPIDELKVRAEILHKRIVAGDDAARARLRALPEFAKADDAALFATEVQRKHCLAVVARETGFSSWEHASRVLRGDASENDFGSLLYGSGAGGTLNAWYVDYAEARAHLDERRRAGELVFLLAFKRQFMIVGTQYVEALGLASDDVDWEALGYDWIHPADSSARTRLTLKRLEFLGGRR
jgi:hypothetical protein